MSSNREKKLHTCFGKVEVSKKHPLCQHTKKFGISPKLQEIACLLARSHVFEESEDLLSSLLGISISAKQIQRVSEHYGGQMEVLSVSFGQASGFFNKFDPYLDLYKNKVIIADGAKWIWKWADDFQCDAVEKLSAYAALEYEDLAVLTAAGSSPVMQGWLLSVHGPALP